MQRFLNIGNPCAGGVFAPTVKHERGRFRHADFLHVGVECEIAVRLARPCPPLARLMTADSVAGAIGACMAAIEVVDDRYEDYKSFDTPTLIADDFFNAALRVRGSSGRLARARSDRCRSVVCGSTAARSGRPRRRHPGPPAEPPSPGSPTRWQRGAGLWRPASSCCSAAWSRPGGSKRATGSRSRSKAWVERVGQFI